jgi:UDP-N-acetyl-D-mannosaminuronate dehydrogenase
MKSLVVGMGQIGTAVAQTIAKCDDVLTYDVRDGAVVEIAAVDILHVCIPFKDEASFLATVQYYIKFYKPMHVLIWSTVAIGTTKKINGAVHSPVEGRHPALTMSVRTMVRWLGANNEGEGEFFAKYFKELWIKPHVVNNSDFTEFLKLRSTSRFGINLAFAEYESSVASELGMDYRLLKDFDRDYNKLYRNLGMDWAQRYVLNAPGGKIGGHCVVPNAKLLDAQFPSDFLKRIIEME